jgi:hypothetical protein
MGFWSPQSLIADAQRHGVDIRRADVNRRRGEATLEEGGLAIRLGLSSVRSLGDDTAQRIVSGNPWMSMEDPVRRAGVKRTQLESLATGGALRFLPDHSGANGRRALLWTAGAGRQSKRPRTVCLESSPVPKRLTCRIPRCSKTWLMTVVDRHDARGRRHRADPSRPQRTRGGNRR